LFLLAELAAELNCNFNAKPLVHLFIHPSDCLLTEVMAWVT